MKLYTKGRIKTIIGSLLSLLLTTCLLISCFFITSFDSYADTVPSLSDKSIYWVDNYVSGDCNLCSNAYMLKRMAILLGSKGYSSISNTSMRGIASFDCGDGYTNDVYNTYTFRNPGDLIEFTVNSKSLTGSSSDKEKTLKNLLKDHPEGIVVWGPNAIQDGWAHAVLITGYNTKTKKFRCADSAYNKGSYNKGVINFSDSMMRGISYCTRYYYISKVTLRKVNMRSVDKKSATKVSVRWGDIYGQNRYQISKSTSKTGTKIVKTIKATVSNPQTLSVKKNTTYYYKVRGYNLLTYKDWAGKTHTKKVYGKWSDPIKFKLQ